MKSKRYKFDELTKEAQDNVKKYLLSILSIDLENFCDNAIETLNSIFQKDIFVMHGFESKITDEYISDEEFHNILNLKYDSQSDFIKELLLPYLNSGITYKSFRESLSNTLTDIAHKHFSLYLKLENDNFLMTRLVLEKKMHIPFLNVDEKWGFTEDGLNIVTDTGVVLDIPKEK